MSGEYGITTQSDGALEQLIVENCIKHPLLLDAAATAAVGQVVQYNTTNDNWDDFTSGMAASLYAVVAETKTLSADTLVECIVGGKVSKTALDATAQADAEIDIALIKSGIYPVSDDVRVA